MISLSLSSRCVAKLRAYPGLVFKICAIYITHPTQLVVGLLSLVVMAPIFILTAKFGFFMANDYPFHYGRLLGVVEGFRDGQILPQLNPTAFFNAGHGVMMFYGPASIYLITALRIITPSWPWAMVIFEYICVAGSALIVCNFTMRLTNKTAKGKRESAKSASNFECALENSQSVSEGSSQAIHSNRLNYTAISASFIFLTSCSVLGALYQTLAYTTCLSILCITALVTLFYRIFFEGIWRNRYYALIILSLGLLITSHMITLLIAVVFFALFFALHIKKVVKQWRSFVKIIACGLISLGLTTWFTLPLIENLKYPGFNMSNPLFKEVFSWQNPNTMRGGAGVNWFEFFLKNNLGWGAADTKNVVFFVFIAVSILVLAFYHTICRWFMKLRGIATKKKAQTKISTLPSASEEQAQSVKSAEELQTSGLELAENPAKPRKFDYGFVVSCSIIMLLSAFLCTKYIPWEKFPKIVYTMQSPNRTYIVSGILMSFAIAFILRNVKIDKVVCIILISACLIFLVQASELLVQWRNSYHSQTFAKSVSGPGVAATGEYLTTKSGECTKSLESVAQDPKNSTLPYMMMMGDKCLHQRGFETKVVSGSVSILSEVSKGSHYDFKVADAENDAKIEVAKIYYLGYKAYAVGVDGKQMWLNVHESDGGLVALDLPEGFEGEVHLYFGFSKMTMIGFWVSVLTFVGCAVWLVVCLRRRRRMKRQALQVHEKSTAEEDESDKHLQNPQTISNRESQGEQI